MYPLSQIIRSLELLLKEDILKIHQGSLEILKKIGVKIDHGPSLEILADGGAKVDFHRKIAKLPYSLVEDCIKKAPNEIRLYGQDPKYNVEIGDKNVYSLSGGGATEVLDLNGNFRKATLKDLQDLTRLEDALENPNVMHGIVDPTDIPEEGMFEMVAATLFKNTYKPCCLQIRDRKGVRNLFEMATIIRGSEEEARKRPLFSIHDSNAMPPLRQTTESGEVIIELAKLGVPNGLTVYPLLGLTSPVTIAGTLAQKNANYLCGLTIVQLINPGTSFLYPVGAGAIDMKTGNIVTGSPEVALIEIAGIQLAHFYNLPCVSQTCSDSKLPDVQVGFEKMLTILLSILGGANLIQGCGSGIDGWKLASFEQCVIDDEILGAVFRVFRGFEVSEETLAFSVIQDIFSTGVNYIEHPHTLKHFRKVLWEPKISVRKNRQSWEREGGEDLREVARKKAIKILEEHYPKPLSKEVEKEIFRIAQRTQKRVVL